VFLVYAHAFSIYQFRAGNEHEIESQEDGAALQEKWVNEYGTVFRYAGNLGVSHRSSGPCVLTLNLMSLSSKC
jgi:hypothetical protein